MNVGKAFEEYYKVLLGSDDGERIHVDAELVKSGPVVTDEHIALLSAPFTKEEVRKAVFSIPGAKSPGPDGFNSSFFKMAWGVGGG